MSQLNNAPEAAALREIAHELADAARVETLAHFRAGSLFSDNKSCEGFDPVTVADRAAEAAMRALLKRHRPQDAVLGEEEEATPGTSGLTWVLDPIDGTRGYISGTPTWGVLIALQDASGPVYGLIDQPYIGERFEGGLGVARCVGPAGEAALRTSAVTDLAEATLMSTFPEIGAPQERAAFEAVSRQCRLTRYGMDCYAYALLAAGHVDLVIEAGLNAYDVAAPIAVIEAAGGCVTSWDGGSAHGGGRILAAATPELHAAAVALLSDAR